MFLAQKNIKLIFYYFLRNIFKIQKIYIKKFNFLRIFGT
jgi:hypothetical protein